MLVSPDQSEISTDQLEDLAEDGNLVAQFYLGMSYYTGVNTEVDLEKAVECFTVSANMNHPESQFILGQCYYYGNGVLQDLEQSANWYRKAAELGHTQAQINLAGMLINGTGIEKSPEYAALCLEMAMETGSAEAAVSLGRLYEEGLGKEQSFVNALECYEKALASDASYSDASYSIALLLIANHIPGRASFEAVNYLETAIENGNVLALYELAQQYYLGELVIQDLEQSRSLYKIGAEKEHALAQFKYGIMQLEGIGGDVDTEQAIQYLTAAADNNVPEAIFSLGMLYYQGKRIKEDPITAKHYFENLAAKGNADSHLMLGLLFENKFKDTTSALQHFGIAVELGNLNAQEQLERLKEAGTPT